MEEAILWKENEVNGRVMCPFCYDVHVHGLAGEETLVGQTKTSDCGGGDYKVAALNPKIVMTALHRRKGELQRKRKARVKAKGAPGSPPAKETAPTVE